MFLQFPIIFHTLLNLSTPWILDEIDDWAQMESRYRKESQVSWKNPLIANQSFNAKFTRNSSTLQQNGKFTHSKFMISWKPNLCLHDTRYKLSKKRALLIALMIFVFRPWYLLVQKKVKGKR